MLGCWRVGLGVEREDGRGLVDALKDYDDATRFDLRAFSLLTFS